MNPDKIRNVLNILFMVLALAAIIIYFAAKDDFKLFIYVCGRGVIVNLEHAKDLEGAAFRMADGSRVFVSQDLLKSARQALMEFLLQRRRMA